MRGRLGQSLSPRWRASVYFPRKRYYLLDANWSLYTHIQSRRSMTSSPQPPFSARSRGQHRQIDADFPTSARSGLLHLLSDLVERRYFSDWTLIARELHRIGRLPLVTYFSSSTTSLIQAREDAQGALQGLDWEKIYDFCERLYGHLPQEIGYEDNFGNYTVQVSRGDMQTYIATELQRLFLEEDLAYEFTEGTVRRRG